MDGVSNLLGFRSRLDEVRERYDKYKLEFGLSRPTTTVRHSSRTEHREPTPVSPISMETPINQLRWLIEPKIDDENDLQLKVVSILGVEGVGKSTLAQKLWLELEGQFELKAFVQTAKTPDMRIILKSIVSQIHLQQTPEDCPVPNLIHDIREHLQDKRYFIIIDDLWAVSVWDVLSRSFPEGNLCSRIITTTTIDDVALASCSYDPEHIFQLEPLDADHSYQLFISRVFGSGKGCPQQFSDVSADVTRKCGGLPLAIICLATVVASQPETIDHWEFVQSFLHHNLRTNSTFAEILKQVLKLCYGSLPHCLKTCLLYLSAYPENYVFLKGDLVKQWVAEDFICTMEGTDLVEVASSYFDELLSLGLIQRMDTNSKKKGLSFVVHPAVFDFIACKSSEDNFITVIDYSQPTITLTDKIRRLALHFGSATYATIPANMGLSQVRSITFTGLLSCMPPLVEFELVRVMILHLQGDVGNTRFSLVEISKLCLLRYVQVRCSVTVTLPDKMHCLKHLETLEVYAVVAAVPSDVVDHPSLLHVRLGRKTKFRHLTPGPVASGSDRPWVDSNSDSNPPLQIFQLPSLICIFPMLPESIQNLHKLRILEIAVRKLCMDDICLLGELPVLTALSLNILTPRARHIRLYREMFPALEYFKFVCGVLLLDFKEEAMPKLQTLKIGFNAHRGEKYDHLILGVQCLSSLQEIAASIGAASGAEECDRIAAVSAFSDAIRMHPRHPSFKVKRVHRFDEEYDISKSKSWSLQEECPSEQGEVPMEHRPLKLPFRSPPQLPFCTGTKTEIEEDIPEAYEHRYSLQEVDVRPQPTAKRQDNFRLLLERPRWRLAFGSPPQFPIYTGTRIEDTRGNPMEVILIDADTGVMPSVAPQALPIQLVPLFGDFSPDDREHWDADEFQKGVVKEREGKQPLLTGDVNLTMRDGHVTVNELQFTDNSSWVRCRKFRIGVRVVPGSYHGGRILEAMTRPFVVRNLRATAYGKLYPPALGDAVWRLEKIGKNGGFHSKLASNNIDTVQEFLRMLMVKPKELRAMLGMTDRVWESVTKHAKTCVPGDKVYAYDAAHGTIYVNSIFSLLFKMEIDGVQCPLKQLEGAQTMLVRQLILEAYEHRHNLKEADADMFRGHDAYSITMLDHAIRLPPKKTTGWSDWESSSVSTVTN